MNNDDVIFDLAVWIDTHLETPLSLDIVAARSGYSKWHLQRRFKDVSGQLLGQYIRGRRLSCAALELRMTCSSILSIALKYRFDSQQTLTRAFTKQFGVAPAAYRNSDEWDHARLTPPLLKGSIPIVAPKVITLPRQYLNGMLHSYICQPAQMSKFDMDVREHFWWRHFSQQASLSGYLYGLSQIGPSERKKEELEIAYATAVDMPAHLGAERTRTAILLQEGDYLQFDYTGTAAGLQPFIIAINQYHLPRLKVVRRKGADIERYSLLNQEQTANRPGFIHCSYFIPCANANAVSIYL